MHPGRKLIYRTIGPRLGHSHNENLLSLVAYKLIVFSNSLNVSKTKGDLSRTRCRIFKIELRLN